MGSFQNQHRAAGWLRLASALLVCGLVFIGISSLRDDYDKRSHQQELVLKSNDGFLQEQNKILANDLSLRLAAISELVIDYSEKCGEIAPGNRSVSAMTARLPGALSERSEFAAIIYQSPVGLVSAFDRFGSKIEVDQESWDTEFLIEQFPREPFVNTEALERFMVPSLETLGLEGSSLEGSAASQGDAIDTDSKLVGVFVPLGDGNSWLGFLLRESGVAPNATIRSIEKGSVSSQKLERSDSSALLLATRPFFSSSVTASRTVIVTSQAPVTWLPFFARALGLFIALCSGVIVATNLARLRKATTSGLKGLRTQGGGGVIAFEDSVHPLVETNESGQIVAANQAFSDLVGIDLSDLLGNSIIEVTAPTDRKRHLSCLDPVFSGELETNSTDFRLNIDSKREPWVHASYSRGKSPDGSMLVLGQLTDISFTRFATWELAKQSLHDELTGLPNRVMVMHRMRTILADTSAISDQDAFTPEADLETHNIDELAGLSDTPGRGTRSYVGVMFINIDRISIVNDSMGHDTGDRLIKYVAQRISIAARANDIVSRFGGDEFVVVCPEIRDVSEVLAIAERIRTSVVEPFVDDSGTVHATVSIGIASARSGEVSAEELLRDADAAMYQAKSQGRNRLAVFNESLRHVLDEQVELEGELRQAIQDETVEMYFQPIVSSIDYSVAGFEALIRWRHPRRGLLTPGQFLPIAEEAGLQERIDTLALKKTCEQMSAWSHKYPAANEMYVSANKVPRNFAKFVSQIEDIVSASGLNPNLLVVEVVENSLIGDADGAIGAIEALKKMGIRVAIDDFGTGYSSLSYLTRFAPTTLKIDRAFVKRMPDEATMSVVQAITEMSLALNINVIAEGVETWEQAQILGGMGVPYFQGYLFGKPLPAHEIEEWFIENAALGKSKSIAPGGVTTPSTPTY